LRWRLRATLTHLWLRSSTIRAADVFAPAMARLIYAIEGVVA
jgi:hypothetical protein